MKRAQVEGPDKVLREVDLTSENEARLLYQQGRDSLNYVRCD
ncbi:MAG: hypothetical protein ACOYMK_02885 [Hyphomonadaceae bacterium]